MCQARAGRREKTSPSPEEGTLSLLNAELCVCVCVCVGGGGRRQRRQGLSGGRAAAGHSRSRVLTLEASLGRRLGTKSLGSRMGYLSWKLFWGQTREVQ